VSGPPPTPSFGASVASVFRLSVTRLVRGKKLRVGSIAVVLVLFAIIAARYAQGSEDPAELVEQGIGLGFFNLLVYLVPFLLTAGAIAEEVESRTFVYVASRPVSRFAMALGKYLAGTALSIALLVGGLLILHVGCYLTTPTPMIDELPETLRAAGVVAMLTFLYAAICMFWGAVATEAAGIVSVLYLAIMEFGFGKLPFFLRFISLNFLGAELAGLPRGGLLPESVPEIEVWIGAVAIPVVTLAFLGFAAMVVSSSEYRFGRA
jgi:ABC-type transport system involved in multi-copper enzyme maturation permease subunit